MKEVYFNIEDNYNKFDIVISKNKYYIVIFDSKLSSYSQKSNLVEKINRIVQENFFYDTANSAVSKRDALSLMSARTKVFLNQCKKKELSPEHPDIKGRDELCKQLDTQLNAISIIRNKSLCLEVLTYLLPLTLTEMAKEIRTLEIPLTHALKAHVVRPIDPVHDNEHSIQLENDNLNKYAISYISNINGYFEDFNRKSLLPITEKTENLYFKCRLNATSSTYFPDLYSIHDNQSNLYKVIDKYSFSLQRAEVALQEATKEEINAFNTFGQSPLHRAVEKAILSSSKKTEFLQFIELLTKAGANINMFEANSGRTNNNPLSLAVAKGDIETTKKLLELGADSSIYSISYDNFIGQTPLHIAIANRFWIPSDQFDYMQRNDNYLEIIKLLLSHNADPMAPDRWLDTDRYPIYEAAYHGDKELFFLLLDCITQRAREKNPTGIVHFEQPIPKTSIAQYGQNINTLVDLLFFNKRWEIIQICLHREELSVLAQLQQLVKKYPDEAALADDNGYKLVLELGHSSLFHKQEEIFYQATGSPP